MTINPEFNPRLWLLLLVAGALAWVLIVAAFGPALLVAAGAGVVLIGVIL